MLIGARRPIPVIQSVLLILATAVVTWFVARWARLEPERPRSQSSEEREADRAKDIGTQLDGARDRASVVEVERNRVALAKAVKAALWVTDARLNVAVPELLKMAQRWVGHSEVRGKNWKPPKGVTDIEGHDDPRAPWAAWSFKQHHWRIEGEWGPSIVPEEIEEDIGTCRVLVDHEVVLDMTISSKNNQVMWIDALTVGPWVSDLLAFAGAQTSDAQARSSARSAQENQDRADKIHWS
jgi:hypothetical protein